MIEMADTIGIGIQDFGKIREKKIFYIDKTNFIKEWWESEDDVTLLTRPRRFGKTLLMSTLDYYLSIDHKEDKWMFEGLEVWMDEEYRQIQGSYPVIFLSFANIKENTFTKTLEQVNNMFTELVDHHIYHNEGILEKLTAKERKYFDGISPGMNETVAEIALHNLSNVLSRYYGQKVIILLDEYDAPMQEAYIWGFWDEMASFAKNLFNATFKTNPFLERAIMTGITRVGKESIFSDLNNLKVITTTSTQYETSFGFTEQEVFDAMDVYGYTDKNAVKYWYDGFTFGNTSDIYNPWSIINFLQSGELAPYWTNTSSNGLVGNLICKGNRSVKQDFEELLRGNALRKTIDSEIIFNQLDIRENAIWSLLLAGGYLKVIALKDRREYALALTNHEVHVMFEDMVRDWFDMDRGNYNDFIKALLSGDLEEMNEYMSDLTAKMFSFFDVGGSSISQDIEVKESERASSEWKRPERFYHGFVLGLLVELSGRYEITSNRESGLGRYDIILCPLNEKDDGIIIEFKALNPKKGENTLEDTASSAIGQIEKKRYDTSLIARGIPEERIRKYGFAFCGKDVLIKSS